MQRMRTIDIGDGKALLVRENGQYFAVGHKCTHYGAPLSTGHLSNGRVRCPWHGACFNIKTGDIEDFPGLDSIPKFEVCKCKLKWALNVNLVFDIFFRIIVTPHHLCIAIKNPPYLSLSCIYVKTTHKFNVKTLGTIFIYLQQEP